MVEVPDGFVPYAQVRERGWSRRAINRLLDEADTVRLEDPPPGMSPRVFRVAAVEQVEAERGDELAAIVAEDAARAAAKEAARDRRRRRRHRQRAKARTNRVDATCVSCGTVRQVRPKLIAGYDVLLCASHRREGLPDPGREVRVTHGVAGWFDGFTYVEPAGQSGSGAVVDLAARREQQAENERWRRRSRLLADEITAAVGPDGWDLADHADEGRGVFTVKVYTGWGWAGFLTGTAGEIADMLAETKFESDEAVSGLTCRACGHQFGLYDATGTACGCGGTLLFRPSSSTGELGGAETAAQLLADAPPVGTVTEQLLLAAFTRPHPGWCTWEVPAGAETGADALAVVVLDGTWDTVHGHLVGTVPTGARWTPGEAGELADAAGQLGYRLRVESEWNFGRQELAGWFERDLDSDGLPVRFTAVRDEHGGWMVAAGTSGTVPEGSGPPDGNDEWDAWQAAWEDADDCWWTDHAGPVDGWEPDLSFRWWNHESGPAASATVPAGRFTVEALDGLLRAGAAVADDAVVTVQQLHAQLWAGAEG